MVRINEKVILILEVLSIQPFVVIITCSITPEAGFFLQVLLNSSSNSPFLSHYALYIRCYIFAQKDIPKGCTPAGGLTVPMKKIQSRNKKESVRRSKI